MISTERKWKKNILIYGLFTTGTKTTKRWLIQKTNITAGLIKIESFMVKLQLNTAPTSLKTAIDRLAYLI